MTYDQIPEDLKSLPNWVGWKLEERNGKPTKVPYSSAHELASSTDPKTWRKFEEVCNIPQSKEKGIGFVFDGNGIVGIDIDHCLSPDGTIDPKFAHIPAALNSYTEISPSGTGLHVFIRCTEEPYDTGKKKGDVEIYSKERYFTVTGNVYKNIPINTVHVQTVRALLDPFFTIPKIEFPRTITTASPNLSDEDIVSIACKANNSQKFERLMGGHVEDYASDRSVADMALASMLAFYTTDPGQIERIMRRSGLVREKWDKHPKYLQEYTISKAIQMCNHHYEPTFKGDASEGAAIAASFINPTPVAPTQQISNIDYKKILEDARKENKLPPFPELPDGIFKDYVGFGERISYSTKEFHFAALLPILSMALGRRVVTNIGMMKLYPNVFAMVVGPTTISGKSYACNMAINELAYIVEHREELATCNSTEVKSKTISEAALIQGLNDVYNLLWHFDDCRPFFEEALKWNTHILGTLCTIYDGSKVERTLSKRGKNGEANSWVCPEPFVSLLFNTTNDDFEASANSSLFTSGFIPRMMMFIGEGGKMRENEDVPEHEKKFLEGIKINIREIRDALYYLDNDSIQFGVCKTIEKWKIESTNKHLGAEEDVYRIAIARGFLHAYKIATIMTVFDKNFKSKYIGLQKEHYPIKCNIPEEYAQFAIDLVEKYLLPRTIYIHSLCEELDKKNHQTLVRNSLKKLGGAADRTKLLRLSRLGKKDLDAAIATMIESEEIETYNIVGADSDKPKTIIKLLKN